MGLKLNGATSGSIEIDVPAVAGTDTAITIPATTGGEFIVSDSSGNIDLGPLDINGGAADDSVNIDGSGRLLVGTTTNLDTAGGFAPNLQIAGTVTDPCLSIFQYRAAVGGGATLSLAHSRGATVGTQTVLQSGDTTGRISFEGSDGTNPIQSAEIKGEVDGTPGTNDMPGRLVFSTTADGASSPTERMRIDSQGYLKVSDTGAYRNVASSEHEFNQHAASEWAFRVCNHHSSQPFGITVDYANSAPNSTSFPFFHCTDSSVLRFQARSNGGLANFQSNDANLCDEREKKNIEPLDSTWNCLKNWDLKKFHYNEDADTDDKRYGVIAQQVAEHCPEVITDWVKQDAADAVLDEDGNIVTPAKEEIVRMGVREQQMYWMAIRALQEAQTRIETLEAKVAQLEGGAA